MVSCKYRPWSPELYVSQSIDETESIKYGVIFSDIAGTERYNSGLHGKTA